MENDKFFPNGSGPNPLGFVGMASSCSSSGMDIQLGELNCGSDQLPNCFLNLNWENSMIQQQQQQQSLPFESALSSMVSSPAAASNSSAAVPADSVVIRELIGKLGSICNSGEISPQSHTLASYSANNSCYSTPLNSPPKLNLSMMDHHQVRGNLPISGNSIPPHPSLAPFPADPGFAERAARFSCFGTGNYGGLNGQFRLNETELPNRSSPNLENGKLSRVSSNQSLKAAAGSQMGVQESKEFPFQDGIEMDMRSGSASASASDRKFTRFSRSSTPEDAEFGNAHEESSASEVIPSGETNLKVPNEGNARKRKAATKGKAKDFPSSSSVNETKISQDDDSNAKRCKSANDGNEKGGEVKAKVEPNGSGNTGGDGVQKQTKDNSKPPEPLKDYIHVRARRGQATDSHSLAERVRREKISERMKFLQDLVPGCNKVTGKAVMLDEIINYVQSLQRQVEFLSMKLATVNPRLDFNVDSLLSKDILHSRGSFPHPIYPMDSSASAFHYGHQPQQGLPLQSGISDGAETQCSINPLDSMLRRSLSMQLPPLDGFGDAASQLAAFWEDDLQSVVQMGFGGPNQTKETAFQSQSFHGSLPMTNMKVEL